MSNLEEKSEGKKGYTVDRKHKEKRKTHTSRRQTGTPLSSPRKPIRDSKLAPKKDITIATVLFLFFQLLQGNVLFFVLKTTVARRDKDKSWPTGDPSQLLPVVHLPFSLSFITQ